MTSVYRLGGDLINNHDGICKNLGHLVQHIPMLGLTLVTLTVVLNIVRVTVNADVNDEHVAWLDLTKEL